MEREYGPDRSWTSAATTIRCHPFGRSAAPYWRLPGHWELIVLGLVLLLLSGAKRVPLKPRDEPPPT
jgi:hypothetical protein